MFHKCKSCDYQSPYKANMRRHENIKHGVTQPSNASQPQMLHFCAHCDYKSDDKRCVGRHQSRQHKTRKEEQPSDCELVEDSIEVFKIYKLLQRMKNKD